MFAMQNFTYFLNTYGKQRGTTVMHRMRTWYNTQARLADRENKPDESARFASMADAMSVNISGAKAVR